MWAENKNKEKRNHYAMIMIIHAFLLYPMKVIDLSSNAALKDVNSSAGSNHEASWNSTLTLTSERYVWYLRVLLWWI